MSTAATSAPSWRSPPTLPGWPTLPTSPSCRWATTCSPPARWWRRSPWTPPMRAPITTSAAPSLVVAGEAEVYDFAGNHVPGATDRDRGYWRDVGTLDAYYDAHMDLISVQPIFNLYNDQWPILTWHEPLPPAKFVLETPGSVGHAIDSMVCAGVIVSGGTVRRSVLSPGERVREGFAISDDGVVVIGKGQKIEA